MSTTQVQAGLASGYIELIDAFLSITPANAFGIFLLLFPGHWVLLMVCVCVCVLACGHARVRVFMRVRVHARVHGC